MPLSILHSPGEIVAYLLVELGLGATPTNPPQTMPDWPVYAESEPDTPDNCITVYTTVGRSDGRSMIDGELYEHYGIQVRVRGQTFTEGWQKADAIRRGLAAVYRDTIAVGANRYFIETFANIADVTNIGRAGSVGRNLFTVDSLTVIERAV